MTDRLLSLWGQLIELDHSLFRRINQIWVSEQVDPLAVWIRESTHWIPLYAALFGLAIWKRRYNGLTWFAFGVLAVICTDLIGNYGFKHVFDRLRPCNDPLLQPGLRLLLNKCSAGFSFVSNHAANHMCLALFVWVTLRKVIGPWGAIGLIWALSIAYAQIYVGVHFPADAVAGSLLGGIIGSTLGLTFNRRYKNSIFPDNQPSQ